MWDDLIAALDSTGFPFAHYAWTESAPERQRDHGVYAEDNEKALYANNKRAEHVLQGSIDLYTKDDSGAPKRNVEEALDAYNIPFRLDYIEYERDTGFIHYEWIFEILDRDPATTITPLRDPSYVQFEDEAEELLYGRG